MPLTITFSIGQLAAWVTPVEALSEPDVRLAWRQYQANILLDHVPFQRFLLPYETRRRPGDVDLWSVPAGTVPHLRNRLEAKGHSVLIDDRRSYDERARPDPRAAEGPTAVAATEPCGTFTADGAVAVADGVVALCHLFPRARTVVLVPSLKEVPSWRRMLAAALGGTVRKFGEAVGDAGRVVGTVPQLARASPGDFDVAVVADALHACATFRVQHLLRLAGARVYGFQPARRIGDYRSADARSLALAVIGPPIGTIEAIPTPGGMPAIVRP
jgi:hypothetical protein